jgi:hypothetical protein
MDGLSGDSAERVSCHKLLRQAKLSAFEKLVSRVFNPCSASKTRVENQNRPAIGNV